MPSNPLNAYRDVERTTLEGRDLEAMVLSKAAALLQTVRNDWNAADLEARLDEALKYNLKLWTLFQAEVSSEESALPQEIKQNLLTLSRFVDKRTFEVLSLPAPEKLDILIAINQNIAAGLREKPVTEAAVAAR